MLLKIQNALKSHVTTICFILTYKKLAQFTENHLSIQVKDITPQNKNGTCWMAEKKGTILFTMKWEILTKTDTTKHFTFYIMFYFIASYKLAFF